MARSIKGQKGDGYDYWSRRPGNNGSQGYGPSVKKNTHRKERMIDKAIEHKASQIILSERDAELFLQYLRNPPPPNAKLRALAKRYKLKYD